MSTGTPRQLGHKNTNKTGTSDPAKQKSVIYIYIIHMQRSAVITRSIFSQILTIDTP